MFSNSTIVFGERKRHMKMRVAIVISHPIQHFCPLFAEWAQASHWQLHVFFGSTAGLRPYRDKDFGKTVSWGDLKLDQVPHSFLNGDLPVPIDGNLDAKSLNQQLTAYEPDAVLSYGYAQRLQRRAQRWAATNRCRLLMFSDSELRHYRPAWTKIAKRLTLPHLLKAVDWFVTTGNANEEYYRHYGVSPSQFVRGSYPIAWRDYQSAYANRAKLRQQARERLGIAQDIFLVSTVGKLVEWKRQVDIIRAVAMLRSPRAVAMIVGSGERLASLQEEASKLGERTAVFLDFVAPERLPELYAASDVYVHASSKEPHSVAVSEAIFMGLPVIVSDRCGSYGTDDDVRPGVNGFVYPCGKAAILADYLMRLFRDEDLRLEMGDASHRIGSEQQSITYERLPRTLLTLLQDGVHAGPAPVLSPP
jgi:glycosyltransferase involved in cell wall biosynthesis